MRRVRILAWVVWLECLRRKDAYVMTLLLAALLFSLSLVNVFGLGGVVRYVLDVGLMLAWLFSIILVIGLVARQLPQEEARGTIFPLLSKPVRRGEVLLGKWLGGWTISCVITLVFYAVVVAALAYRGGTVQWTTLAQALALHWMALGILASAALAASTRLTFGAAATLAYMLAVIGWLLVPAIPEWLDLEGAPLAPLLAMYHSFPHVNLFDLRLRVVHDWGPLSGSVFGAIVGYGAVWMAVFLLLAELGYRRKTFRRDVIP